MPARSVAMPKRRPPKIYPIPTSVKSAGRAPRFTLLTDPEALLRRLSTNLGAVVANSGRIKAVAKTKADWSAQLRLNRR
jgi:hypothetical protein